MSVDLSEPICEENLSHAWAKALLHVVQAGHRAHLPLMISIGGFVGNEPIEDPVIRKALDTALRANREGASTVSETAMLIFPFDFWKLTRRPDIDAFTGLYMQKYLPRLRARNRLNARGTYFQRMVSYQGVKCNGGKIVIEPTNQLKHIIEIWKRDRKNGRRPRRSALQVSCFDPPKDHNGSALSVFPCLQQVSFGYYEDNHRSLAVNAYYPTQYVFDRAYGNYLGLCHLGHFMARELDLDLVRFNCFVGCPELGRVKPKQIKGLLDLVRERIPL